MATEEDQEKKEKKKAGLPSHIRNNLMAQKREIQTINTSPASGRVSKGASRYDVPTRGGRGVMEKRM